MRVAADLGDAVVLGTALPDHDARRRAAGVALLWGGPSAATALTLR